MFTITLPTGLSFDETYPLLELVEALEAGFGARYDDRHNYGDISLYKLTNRCGDYYFCWWGNDIEESRQWSNLEAHFDRLDYRLNSGWQLISREEVERLKTQAKEEVA